MDVFEEPFDPDREHRILAVTALLGAHLILLGPCSWTANISATPGQGQLTSAEQHVRPLPFPPLLLQPTP